MKVLIVSSGNAAQISPFICEQVESVERLSVEFKYFSILGKGISGYLKNVRLLKSRIKSYRPDIIHAHYGLSGLLSILAKGRTPLITTFHGNDINTLYPLNKFRPNWNKIFSGLVHFLCNHSIFVTEDIANQIKARPSKSDIIPCQVNLDTFYPVDKVFARKQLNLSPENKYILFCSSFNIPIKNYQLAKEACLKFKNMELIELKGFTRQEVNLLLNACNAALISSYNEGSNQFLKEALACNRPVVTTKTGDSAWIFGDLKGCYLTSFDPEDVADKLNLAIEFDQNHGNNKGRERIIELGLDSDKIAQRIFGVYKKVLANTQ